MQRIDKLILMLALAVAAPGQVALGQASAPAESPAAKALRELFSQDDPPAAAKQIDAVLAAVGNDVVKLKAAIAADLAYEPFPPGPLNRSLQFRDGEKTYDVTYVVRVPRGYDGRKSWPLLVVFHGQHGNGPKAIHMMEEAIGAAAEQYVMLAPTMPGPDNYSGQAYQEQSCLRPLAWVRTRLNIDDDRIVVTGYSLGGHHAWHMATMFPHLWAAAVPMAGVPWFEGGPSVAQLYLENLQHLPLWASWGEKDTVPPPALGTVDLCRQAAARLKELKNANFIGTEVAGAGHEGAWPGRAELLTYLAAARRPELPASFQHCFHQAHHARGYCLEATGLVGEPLDFTKTIQVPVGGPTTRDAAEAISKFMAARLYRVSCQRDAAANSLTVRGTNIRAVRLCVGEGMFDATKPAAVRYWSRTWKGDVPASARCMLLHYAAARDQSRLTLNELDLEQAGKAIWRFK